MAYQKLTLTLPPTVLSEMRETRRIRGLTVSQQILNGYILYRAQVLGYAKEAKT